jgi:Tol biopolymer transport system component
VAVVSRLSGHAWTPRGDAVVLASDDPGYRALVLLDPKARTTTLLGAREGQRPAFADDGSLAYELARFDANVWAWSAADGKVRQVAGSTRYDGTPRIAPDGRRFAYVSTRADQESIWIASLDGAPEQRVPLDPGVRWTLPDFSPDGEFLLLTAWEGSTTALYEHELASGRTRRLDAAGADAFAGQYAGDGATIVFARRGEGAQKSLWRGARDGSASVPMAPRVDRFAVSGQVVLCAQRGQRGLDTAAAGRWRIAHHRRRRRRRQPPGLDRRGRPAVVRRTNGRRQGRAVPARPARRQHARGDAGSGANRDVGHAERRARRQPRAVRARGRTFHRPDARGRGRSAALTPRRRRLARIAASGQHLRMPLADRIASLRLQRFLITGALTLLPLWLTWIVFKFVFTLLSGISAPWIAAIAQPLAGAFPVAFGWLDEPWCSRPSRCS